MTTAVEHYERHLAPIYLWMAGGPEAALRAGHAEADALGLPRAPGDLIVDLGAGFGAHAVALARNGARVLAIDSSGELLRTLALLAAGLPVQTVNADLLSFPRHLLQVPSAILCMGDTVTHLPGFADVERLVEQAASVLRHDGLLVLSFRDYCVALTGDERFILVRGDESRILTCFLDYEEERVQVHDIIHERTSTGWRSRVSHYPKLRLPPQWLIACLERHGFDVRRDTTPNGMVRLVARRT